MKKMDRKTKKPFHMLYTFSYESSDLKWMCEPHACVESIFKAINVLLKTMLSFISTFFFFLSFKLFIVSRRSFCIATHTSQFFSHTFLLAPWTLYNTIITFRLFDQFFCREKLWRENCNWFKTSFCEKKNNFNWQTTTLFTLFILFAF